MAYSNSHDYRGGEHHHDEKRENLYDSDFNPLVKTGQNVKRIRQQFPMRVGDAWESERPRRNYSEGEMVVVRHDFVGVDRITVPAGTFDCLRIEVDNRKDTKVFGVWRKSQRWYCPEINGIAKEVDLVIERSSYGPGAMTTVTSELVDSNYARKAAIEPSSTGK